MKTFLIILAVILVIALLAVAGYFIYKKFFAKKEVENETLAKLEENKKPILTTIGAGAIAATGAATATPTDIPDTAQNRNGNTSQVATSEKEIPSIKKAEELVEKLSKKSSDKQIDETEATIEKVSDASARKKLRTKIDKVRVEKAGKLVKSSGISSAEINQEKNSGKIDTEKKLRKSTAPSGSSIFGANSTRKTDDSGKERIYENCDAARAAGVTPIKKGELGYDTVLDRDRDGIACE